MGEIRPLTEKEYGLFRDLIHHEAGIQLGPSRQALLVNRLSRRVAELGLRSFGEYHARVAGGRDRSELRGLLERVCTHETHFFREPRQFEFLDEVAGPAWAASAAHGRRPRRLRAWSAGCSTGQEPYSLAMSLLARFPPESGWTVEVVGTDLSSRALEKAREGVYPLERASEIPPLLRKRFMLRGVRSKAGTMAAGDAVRAVVRFAVQNLNDSSYAVAGPFDAVFCRNVLIYFSEQTRRAVVARLAEQLSADGYLFLGHAETLNAAGAALRCVGPAVYQRTGARS